MFLGTVYVLEDHLLAILKYLTEQDWPKLKKIVYEQDEIPGVISWSKSFRYIDSYSRLKMWFIMRAFPTLDNYLDDRDWKDAMNCISDDSALTPLRRFYFNGEISYQSWWADSPVWCFFNNYTTDWEHQIDVSAELHGCDPDLAQKNVMWHGDRSLLDKVLNGTATKEELSRENDGPDPRVVLAKMEELYL